MNDDANPMPKFWLAVLEAADAINEFDSFDLKSESQESTAAFAKINGRLNEAAADLLVYCVDNQSELAAVLQARLHAGP